jgi:hypothetical protein
MCTPFEDWRGGASVSAADGEWGSSINRIIDDETVGLVKETGAPGNRNEPTKAS